MDLKFKTVILKDSRALHLCKVLDYLKNNNLVIGLFENDGQESTYAIYLIRNDLDEKESSIDFTKARAKAYLDGLDEADNM